MRVLVVDDEESFRVLMESELERMGHSVLCVKSGEEALSALAAQDFDAILLDLRMPGIGGMETLRRIKESGASAEVVILTGYPDIEDAVHAMKLGAYDYLTKPARPSELEEVLKRAAEKKRLQKENLALKRMMAQREPPPLILGRSQAIKSLLETVERIAKSDASVLIQGETGTGKGLLATVIHQKSERVTQPFLTINCSAFQDHLLESELFGHEKGAFTGAVGTKLGLFEVADGGILFLDEVGEMSQAMQAKLLQVLDTGELRRVGGTRILKVDVRIIASTNKDLAREVRMGRFREDLYYRMNVISLHLPPLGERKVDIPLLIEHFFGQFRIPGQPVKTVTPEALQLLTEYPWPGNVRELANTVERLVILSPGDVIGLDDLPPNIRPEQRSPILKEPSPLSLFEMERLHITKVLSYTKGRKAQAARILGIDVKTLNHKIRAYHIPG
ncbi:MAG: sigma-54-dependent Fis family transcriptional regulator [candidate division NC10 bacterium]|nr:sigma-54-dependent Fis family transcriptional regulator [candidate division NC10 bacterium]